MAGPHGSLGVESSAAGASSISTALLTTRTGLASDFFAGRTGMATRTVCLPGEGFKYCPKSDTHAQATSIAILSGFFLIATGGKAGFPGAALAWPNQWYHVPSTSTWHRVAG